MNILCDLHHIGLWHSLEFLFEKRLGHNLYCPVGMEWFPLYWGIAEPYGNDIRTATQYLTIKAPPDRDGIYRFDNVKGITLQKFFEMPIDIMIATVPENIEKYKKLITLYKPTTKFIFQMGNMFSTNFARVPNLLSSTIAFPVPSTCNAVFYHQEFDLNIFHHSPPVDTKNIYSFLHTFDSPIYPDASTFYEVEKLLPDWTFKCYGASNRDECIAGDIPVADKIRESRFIWHVKAGGDGYGHTIHNAFAMGRPPIVKQEYYNNKLAGNLMRDGDTCLTIDGLSPEEIRNKILYFNDPKLYAPLSQHAYEIFTKTVDFDKEEETIREFLTRLN